MKKRFAHVIFSFVLAFTMLIPMFPQKASAQCGSCDGNTVIVVRPGTGTNPDVIFIANFNNQINLLRQSIFNAELVLGQARVLELTSAMINISVAQLELERGMFAVDTATFVTAHIVGRSLNISVSRMIQLFNSNPNFGEIALAIGLPQAETLLRVSGFVTLFNNEIGVTNGTSSCGQVNICDADLALLIAILDLFIKNMNDLSAKVGQDAVNQAILDALARELNVDASFLLRQLGVPSSMFTHTSGSAALGFLVAGSISASTGRPLEEIIIELGLDGSFEAGNVAVITPLGAARALAGFGIPVQVAVSRIDVFRTIVSSDVVDEDGVPGGDAGQ